MTLVTTASSLVFFLIFVVAASGKVDGWQTWTSAAGSLFARWPVAVRRALIPGVPALELTVAVSIALSPRLGLAMASVTLAVFAVAVAFLLPSHRGQSCNCFGAVASSRLNARLAIQDATLAAIAAASAVACAPNFTVSLPAIGLTLLAGLLLVVVAEFVALVGVASGKEAG